MSLSISVAVAKNNVIGFRNRLPWHLPADLVYFKKNTLNKTVIMGRKTFESIGKPLPKRENIILTRNAEFKAPGCYIAHSLEEAISVAHSEEIFIIGGARLYQRVLPIVDKLYLTQVDATPQGDAYFPVIDLDRWEVIARIFHKADEKNIYDLTFLTLKRRISSNRKASKE